MSGDARGSKSKLRAHTMIALAPTPFELFAADRGHDIARAVLPDSKRVYADRYTQELFETWNAGAAYPARMLTESTVETPALREKIRELAGLI